MTHEQKVGLWLAFGSAIVILALCVVYYAFSGASQGAQPAFKATTVPALTQADWARGNNKNAAVTLIEYGDFECPACGAYEPIMQQLEKDYADKIIFVFRNFPLYQIHPNAQAGAQAAEAAGLQGKYWEMHDMLFAKQNDWSTGSAANAKAKLDSYAQSLGLNLAKFDSDLAGSVVAAKISKDVASGNAAAIDHTPTFFINLTQIKNPSSYAEFKSVLDATIASSTGK